MDGFQAPHLKQLASLRLDPLGSIHKHDRIVCRRKRAVPGGGHRAGHFFSRAKWVFTEQGGPTHVSSEKSWWPGVSSRLICTPEYSKVNAVEVMEMPARFG
jgi:hypothetical protein